MNSKQLARALTTFALIGGVAIVTRPVAAQPANVKPAPSQAGITYGPLTGSATGVSKPSGGSGAVPPSPSPSSSQVNNYLHQDEQINLDANTGNVRVLRTDQKALINDFVQQTFEIKHVDPRELRNVIRTIVGLEGGDAEVIKDKNGHQNYVQVVAPKFMVPYLQQAIPALDESWVREYDTGSADVYYKAKNRNAADIDFLASQFASEQGFSAVDTTNNAVNRIDEPYRIENYLKGASMVDIPANQVLLEVKIYEVNSQNDLKLGVDYINWKNGPGRNLFEFIYQGFNADSSNDTFTSVFDPFLHPDASQVAAGAGKIDLETAAHQTYRAVNYLLPSSYVDFLAVKGQARVMLNTSEMVKSANTASFSAEDQVVALVSTDGTAEDSTSGDTGSNINGVRFSRYGDGRTNAVVTGSSSNGQSFDLIENRRGDNRVVGRTDVPVRDFDRRLHYENAGCTGLFVKLTPFIGLESLELVADVQVGDMNGFTPTGAPIINTRTLKSTTRLMDGEPYVIAGLKRIHDIKETAKAPGLGDMPIVGYLFGGETDVKRSNDVIIVVTPHFYLSSQTDLSAPQRVKALSEIVSAGREVMLPDLHPGYDQWLLDPKK